MANGLRDVIRKDMTLDNEEHLIFHADSYKVWNMQRSIQKPSASSQDFTTRTIREFGKMIL